MLLQGFHVDVWHMVDVSRQKIGFLDNLSDSKHVNTTKSIVRDFTHDAVEMTEYDLGKALQGAGNFAQGSNKAEVKAGIADFVIDLKKTAADGLKHFRQEGVTIANVSAGINVRRIGEELLNNGNLKLKDQDDAEALVRSALRENDKQIDKATDAYYEEVKQFGNAGGVVVTANGNEAKKKYKGKNVLDTLTGSDPKKRDIKNAENLLLLDKKNAINVGAAEEGGDKGRAADYSSPSELTTVVASGKAPNDEGTSFAAPRITAMLYNQRSAGKSLDKAIEAVKSAGVESKKRKDYEEGDGFISDDKIRETQQSGSTSPKPPEADPPSTSSNTVTAGSSQGGDVASAASGQKNQGEFTNTMAFRKKSQ
jgi:hypothetical protein